MVAISMADVANGTLRWWNGPRDPPWLTRGKCYCGESFAVEHDHTQEPWHWTFIHDETPLIATTKRLMLSKPSSSTDLVWIREALYTYHCWALS